MKFYRLSGIEWVIGDAGDRVIIGIRHGWTGEDKGSGGRIRGEDKGSGALREDKGSGALFTSVSGCPTMKPCQDHLERLKAG